MKKLLSVITSLALLFSAAPYTGLYRTSDSFEAAAVDYEEGEEVLIAVADPETMDYIPGVTVNIELDNGGHFVITTEDTPVVFRHGGHSGLISIAAMPEGYAYAEGFTKERAFMEDSESAVLWLERIEGFEPSTGTVETTVSAITTTAVEETVSAIETATPSPEELFATCTAVNREYGDFDVYFEAKPACAMIAHYLSDAEKDVVIPETVYNFKVESIWYNAFKGKNIKSVSFPKYLCTIGNSTFAECKNLTSVTLPETIKYVMEGAFSNCANLKSVTILNPECELNGLIFTNGKDFSGTIYGYKNSTARTYAEKYGCKFVALDDESFVLTTTTSAVTTTAETTEEFVTTTSPEENIFATGTAVVTDYGKFTVELEAKPKYAGIEKYNSDTKDDVVIPVSVYGINVYAIFIEAFKGTNITSVTLPCYLKQIGPEAFAQCNNLTTVSIPPSVVAIEEGAFKDCTNLKSIIILNPDCEINDSPYTICNERLDGTPGKPDGHFSGIIYGYKNSTAQAYAEKNYCKFVALDGDDACKADVYVTISDDKHKVQIAHEPVIAYDINADGLVTVDEALYAAHEKFYEGGAAAGYSSAVSTYGNALQKLWGIENGGTFGYTVNSVFSNSLDDTIKDGDSVYAYVYTDLSGFSDSYSRFESYTVKSDAGEPIALKLTRSYFDKSYNQAWEAVDNAVITVDGKATEYVTDEKGQVSIIINEPGRHVISASSENYNLIPPVCIAEVKGTATERPEPTLKGDANLDGQVNIADAVLVMQVSTNPDKYGRDKSEFSIKLQGEVNADVDGSAGLTNKDALLIQKFKLGLIKEF